MSLTYEQSKSLLQSTDPKTGQSLYQHLIALLQAVAAESNKENSNNRNVYNELQRLSLQIKKNYQPSIQRSTAAPSVAPAAATDTTTLKQLQHLCAVNKQSNNTTALLDSLTPDLLYSFSLLQQATISPLIAATTVQTYALQLSISELIQRHVLTTPPSTTGQLQAKYTDVRFWGVIAGTAQDYYIVEMKIPHNQQQKQQQQQQQQRENESNVNAGVTDLKVEAAGRGLNEYVYYVTNNYLDPNAWILLPHVKPEWVIQSPSIHRFFTGDLTAPVRSLAAQWKWSESELLRAVIQRITSSTVIAPRGLYQVGQLNADGEEQIDVVTADFSEYEPLTAEELAGVTQCEGKFTADWSNEEADRSNLENWQHVRRHVLKQGRASVYVPPERDDEESDSQTEEQQQKTKTAEELEWEEEEPAPLLSSIADDIDSATVRLQQQKQQGDADGGSEFDLDEWQRDHPVWAFRVYPNARTTNAVVVARNTVWPGAYTVVKSGSRKREDLVSVYVGDGVKSLGGRVYQPAVTAAKLADEWKRVKQEDDDEEIDEQPDPYVLKEQQDPLPPPVVAANDNGDGAEGEDVDEQEDHGDELNEDD